jgi:hypothetical protein
MKGLMQMGLSAFCALFFLLTSNAQTRPKKNQLLPYDDTEGYQVLSFIIDARTNQWKSGSVSIFYRTVSKQALRSIKIDCSDKIPVEFQDAAADLDKKAMTGFRLQQKFSTRKRYRFVLAPVNAEDQAVTRNAPGVFSVSAVGFDGTKTHAIALVQYLVRPTGSIVGGDSTFYLLRKTEKGWQQATEVPKCGRIY